jgi:plasmid stabilization system protein ParE
MTRRLILRPQAEDEIGEAVPWYESRGQGLGAEFLRAVEACIASIQRNPMVHEKIFGEVRRAVLRRFPYILVFRVSDEEIVVAACIHGKRNPKRWQQRL